jgi:hypothetical protein
MASERAEVLIHLAELRLRLLARARSRKRLADDSAVLVICLSLAIVVPEGRRHPSVPIPSHIARRGLASRDAERAPADQQGRQEGSRHASRNARRRFARQTACADRPTR